jgi:ubiquinone/menaquinone biosynthesis C-methylase UbiE
MLRVARKRFGRSLFHECDLGNPLTYPDKSFDYVVSINVLYALPDPAYAISEFRRVLRPGGKMIICTPLQGSNPWKIFLAHLERKGLMKVLPLLLPFVVLGIMNAVILKRSSSGSYHFFSKDQIELLVNVEKLTTTYADQDWLVVGT